MPETIPRPSITRGQKAFGSRVLLRRAAREARVANLANERLAEGAEEEAVLTKDDDLVRANRGRRAVATGAEAAEGAESEQDPRVFFMFILQCVWVAPRKGWPFFFDLVDAGP